MGYRFGLILKLIWLLRCNYLMQSRNSSADSCSVSTPEEGVETALWQANLDGEKFMAPLLISAAITPDETAFRHLRATKAWTQNS